MKKITIKVIQWNSNAYKQGMSLRNELLNKTAQLPLLQLAPECEKKYIHLAAFIDQTVVGTLFLTPVNQYTVQVRQVAVSSNYQGMGIGRQLIAFAEDYARQLGFMKIILDGRDSAWNFYKNLNYQAKGFSHAHGTVTLKRFEKQLLPAAAENNLFIA